MSSQLPSNWITHNAPPPRASANRALDLACGKGRHSFWLSDQGWQVTAIDRDLSQTDCHKNPDINWIEADLETGQWPMIDQTFDLVIVVNYLHRPLFDDLRRSVQPSGTLIYETFMVGNEKYGQPRSPEFLLKPDELRTAFPDWTVMDFKQGADGGIDTPSPTAIRQSIVVQKPA
jgi:SAM-dependent methyltransferase